MTHRGDVRGGFEGRETDLDRHRGGGRPRHLLVAPLAWGLHFAVTYGATALACSGRGPGLEGARLLVVLATAIALVLLAWACARSLRLRRSLAAEPVTPARRQRRFLATITLATCGLAGIAVAFDALPVLFSASCA
jgi:hypothetical protein